MTTWPEDRMWSAIHAERRRLADDLATLTDAQWNSPSLCGEWTIRDVVAHLTAAALTGRWRWLRSVAAARGNFDRHNARRLAEQLGHSPAETLELFTAAAGLRVQPARPTWPWLGEVLVHAYDIREPLGIATLPAQATVDHLAEQFAARDFAVPSKTAAQGLRLVSTDGDLTIGDGPLVSGRSVDLVGAMAGRPHAVDRLTGDGVDILRRRHAEKSA